MARFQRLTREDRRAALLSAGERAFAVRPYEEVSIEDIAAEAGVSKNLLYHYFSGKRELYLETIRAAAEEMLRRTNPDPGLAPRERLAASIDAHLDYIEEHEEGYVALLRGAGGDPEVQEVIRASRDRVVRRTLDQARAFDPSPAYELAVRGWVAFIDEVSVHWLESREPPREELHALLVEQFVALTGTALRPH